MNSIKEPIHVFWTGGWDSTYRVISLLDQGRSVQPHYIVDHERRSSKKEIDTILFLRDLLKKRNSQFGSLLLPPKKVDKSSISRHEDIEKAYLDAIRDSYIGVQYKWLAEYCRDEGIEGIEISVQNNPHIREVHDSPAYPYSILFAGLHFPLITSTKLDMKDWAEENNYLQIMEHTWFCHNPLPSGKPCGQCHPCITVVQEGMGYRLPLYSRFLYHIRLSDRIKTLLKGYPSLYASLYRAKHARRD